MLLNGGRDQLSPEQLKPTHKVRGARSAQAATFSTHTAQSVYTDHRPHVRGDINTHSIHEPEAAGETPPVLDPCFIRHTAGREQ